MFHLHVQSLRNIYYLSNIALIFSSFILSAIHCILPAGKNFESGTIDGIFFGEQLPNSLITVIVDANYTHCIRECSLRPRCLSVNYFRRFLVCELNFQDRRSGGSDLVRDQSSVYSEKRYWREDILAGNCAHHTCEKEEKCQQNPGGGYKCVISDCGQPPNVENASADTTHGIGVYSKVTYKCREGYKAFGKPYIGCQPNGKWAPLRFCCWKMFDGSFYRIIKTNKSWDEARKECETLGGCLAEISSQKENDFLINMIKELGIDPARRECVWLGGTDKEKEGQWKWITSGSRIEEFKNWSPTQPDNHGKNEDCLLIWKSHMWNDGHCSSNCYFACERN